MKPFIDSKSSRNCPFFVFDISNGGDHIAAQPISMEFEFYFTAGRPNATDYTPFALVLTNRLFSNNSDGNRMFDLI